MASVKLSKKLKIHSTSSGLFEILLVLLANVLNVFVITFKKLQCYWWCHHLKIFLNSFDNIHFKYDCTLSCFKLFNKTFKFSIFLRFSKNFSLLICKKYYVLFVNYIFIFFHNILAYSQLSTILASSFKCSVSMFSSKNYFINLFLISSLLSILDNCLVLLKSFFNYKIYKH